MARITTQPISTSRHAPRQKIPPRLVRTTLQNQADEGPLLCHQSRKSSESKRQETFEERQWVSGGMRTDGGREHKGERLWAARGATSVDSSFDGVGRSSSSSIGRVCASLLD